MRWLDDRKNNLCGSLVQWVSTHSIQIWSKWIWWSSILYLVTTPRFLPVFSILQWLTDVWLAVFIDNEYLIVCIQSQWLLHQLRSWESRSYLISNKTMCNGINGITWHYILYCDWSIKELETSHWVVIKNQWAGL